MRRSADGRLFSFFIFALLGAAFFTVGLSVSRWIDSSGAESLFGYDYALYIRQLSDPGWIFYTGVRHPGLGLVLSPVVLAGSAISCLGECWRRTFFVFAFAAVAVANVWLVRKIAGWTAVALFLALGWTWILAAVPESFPVAMLSLLILARFAVSDVRGRRRWIAWVALFIVCSAITVTNGLKVVVAFLIAEKCPRRIKWAALASLLAVSALAVLYFYVRMSVWNASHPEMPKTVSGALAQTLGWIPGGLGPSGRIAAGAVNFFVVPTLPLALLPVGPGLELRSVPSVGLWGWLWAAGVYSLAAVSFWRIRDSLAARVFIGMFSVDAAIHLLCGWGIQEGWIFCAHWFFMLPVTVGLAWGRRRNKDVP